MTEERKQYQREWARKRRREAGKTVDKGVDVVTSASTGVDKDLPWPVNQDKPPRWGPGVPVYIAPTEVEKAAMVKRGEMESKRLRGERKVAA
jgi:hypothetical protein